MCTHLDIDTVTSVPFLTQAYTFFIAASFTFIKPDETKPVKTALDMLFDMLSTAVPQVSKLIQHGATHIWS